MDRLQNEKGYALLLVMLIVVLFTIMGMGLLAMNMNAAKQFNTKEEQVQARHQAEMGVLHYKSILEKFVKDSSSEYITCRKIESLLLLEELSSGSYKIEKTSASEPSCSEIVENEKLKINIKSIGTIDGNTKKEVLAKFYVENLGGATEGTMPTEIPATPPLAEPLDADVKNSLHITKHTDDSEFIKSLIIKNTLSTGTGSETIVKANKHLYVIGGNGTSLDMNNHACIGVGGNFTALEDINLGGQSSIDFIVRKDAYFPSNIINWKGDKTNFYIFGNLYLPMNYNYLTHNNKKAEKGDMNVFVAGKVYQQDINNNYKEKNTHSFYSMEARHRENANRESCIVPEMPDESKAMPDWSLQDNIEVDYK